ncbi:hypothetical protein MAPG_02547 [Magnaporthiopsis poae ATCC 64411]|uniref:VPS9 domain-containing protein n=1 Tax=Magnaporthiopsis poae (strain ATCC 64411 / 73-15) TaxID=644358 RepID=A0A0C4DRN4_MAGP6|nr:hypothetical protein MAPG_02547 [Magnaporthiopsis poae ATCC 64411]
MQPLNPFLGAFFKSSLPAQCSPTAHHVLLVPATDVLLTSRDAENGGSVADVVASEEFLASHVLRIPPLVAGKEAAQTQNLREVRGKAKQYNTVNGRSVVVKDNLVYSNKGFKNLAHATLLGDAIWYSDTLDARQWLVYYISQPLVGFWEEVKIVPALVPDHTRMPVLPDPAAAPSSSHSRNGPAVPRKKDIKSFHDLLSHFPIIARQMQPGLERLLREFTTAFERPLPPPPSSLNIPDPEPDGPITTAIKRARSNSASASKSPVIDDAGAVPNPDDLFSDDDEDIMRTSLETAVTAAIDLFQSVDKQQLSLLGATTDLTGPVVERLIERYVAEHVHHVLFVRLVALKEREDLELDSKIRQMGCIDISQLGLPIEGGSRGRRELTARLGRAVEEFRKIVDAPSPQDMMEVLLSTLKTVTYVTDSPSQAVAQGAGSAPSEKPLLTINADTLVSLLLFVVIRSRVRQLQARLSYIRHFIFIDDVENGEMGYAMSTLEAVLVYLDRDSGVLRRSSRRNQSLWDAAAKGDVRELGRLMGPGACVSYDEEAVESQPSSRRTSSSGFALTNGIRSRGSCDVFSMSEKFSLGSSLDHVFPFRADEVNGANSSASLPAKRVKKVAMDTRSMSSGSEFSFHSRATSVGTLGSVFEADTSMETLSQTHNPRGESVLMIAVQNKRPDTLKYLFSLPGLYAAQFVLDDRNNEWTTLLSAAVQLGHSELVRVIIGFLESAGIDQQGLAQYFAAQDIWGRSVGHYLFHAPFLIDDFGALVPWRQRDKNGQTPLFALCRSYDHAMYLQMVGGAIDAATYSQGDGQPLHLDQHVDAKGNTLLHIVNNAQLALRILQTCDVDVNATNDKQFTPLMVASKYGRFEMVRAFYSDPRIDFAAKELRGLTAVELAKDDDVRNKIDDLTLFSMPSGPDMRTTAVVRAYFVEDATIRFVLKSGAPVDKHSYAVTTCRRSLADFEHLARLLAMENPASWIPSISGLRSPFQLPSKPSRAALKDLQMRMDWFLRIMLTHSTFATHEMLWEFFLVPDLQADMMDQRSILKAETRAEKVREELEPLDDVREVERFVDHALEMVRSVDYSTKSVGRRMNAVGIAATDFFTSCRIFQRAFATLSFLPGPHISAFDIYVNAMAPPTISPQMIFHGAFLAIQSTIEAILAALARPHKLINQIESTRRQAERNYNSLSRSTRWPLGLLDDTRQRMNEEREEKLRQSQMEGRNLAKELKYSQQVVAGELAGWQDMHEKVGRKAIRDLARGMVVMERMRLEGIRRALRTVQEPGQSSQTSTWPLRPPDISGADARGESTGGEDQGVGDVDGLGESGHAMGRRSD